MTKRTLVLFVLIAIVFSGSILADGPDVEVATSSVGGTSVTLEVHNLDTTTEVLRVQVSVVVNGGGEQTLTSPNISVAGSARVSVTLTAGSPIVAIGDDPEPIPPSL